MRHSWSMQEEICHCLQAFPRTRPAEQMISETATQKTFPPSRDNRNGFQVVLGHGALTVLLPPALLANCSTQSQSLRSLTAAFSSTAHRQLSEIKRSGIRSLQSWDHVKRSHAGSYNEWVPGLQRTLFELASEGHHAGVAGWVSGIKV